MVTNFAILNKKLHCIKHGKKNNYLLLSTAIEVLLSWFQDPKQGFLELKIFKYMSWIGPLKY